ncbi:MAG: DUF6714 family protein [Actinomycetota bacterium]
MDRDQAIALIERAFAAVERPTNAELLHPQSADDMDIEPLYDIVRWEDMTDADVIYNYSALAFLSPEGFRYFIPAYLIYALRNPESPEAVVDSTIWSFYPDMYEENLRDFVASKFSLLDDAQRQAVDAFLEAMAPFENDAAQALDYWRGG